MGKEAPSAMSRCLKIILQLQANSVMSERALTHTNSLNPCGGIVSVDQNQLVLQCRSHSCKEKSGSDSSPKPCHTGAEMCTQYKCEHTHAGMGNHRTSHTSCPRNRNCLSSFLCYQNDFSFSQLCFPPLLPHF